MRVGVYASNANGTPAALISASASGDLSGAAVATVTFTFAAPITFTAGTLYWIAVHFSSTTVLRAIPVAACMPISFAAGSAVNTVMRGTQTYGALPTTLPTLTPTSSIVPIVRLTLA
jgi:hypothetical protein